jgi:hypothetical protein
LSAEGLKMPTLAKVGQVKINIYRDHGPPHVHIVFVNMRYYKFFFLEADRSKNLNIPRPGAKAVRWVLDNLPLVTEEWRKLNAPVDYKFRKRKLRREP